MALNRRDFHKTSGAILLSYFLGGGSLLLSPAEAKSRGIPYQIFTPEEAELMALLAEAIVPGSRNAGLSHYIDHQLATPKAESMLILKYMGVQGSPVDFYRPALRAFKKSCPLFQEKNVVDIGPQDLTDYITVMSQKNPPGWDNAPPAPFFYFVLRSDAIDVTYGTMDGFDKLDIPYMAHIEPEGGGWS